MVDRMEFYMQKSFVCDSTEEIWDMHQFIQGELFIYIDQMMTMDDSQINGIGKFDSIEEVVFKFLDFFLYWAQVLPELSSQINFYNSHKNMYHVYPEAAIYYLKNSMIHSINVIFSFNERSRTLDKKLPNLIKGLIFPKEIEAVDRSLHQLNALYFGKFISKNGLQICNELVQKPESDQLSSVLIQIFCSLKEILDKIRATKQIRELAISVSDYLLKQISKMEDSAQNSQESITQCLGSFLRLTGKYESEKQIQDELNKQTLIVIKKCLTSQFIDKKITALNKIMKISENRGKSDSTCKWIIEERIIETIFSDSNPELISRTPPLFRLISNMSKFSKEHVHLLWETCIHEHKHESVIEETLEVIQELAKFVDFSIIELFMAEFKTVQKCDEKMINFLKIFYLNLHENFQRRRTGTKSPYNKVNFTVFWNIITDEEEKSEELKDIAQSSLIEILKKWTVERKVTYISKAIEILKDNLSLSFRALQIIEHILTGMVSGPKTYTNYGQKKGYSMSSIPTDITQLLISEDLIQLILESATKYMNYFKNKGIQNDDIVIGNMSHRNCMKLYFKVIEFLVIKMDSYFKLTQDSLEVMHMVFIDCALTNLERDLFYQFFTFDEFDETQQIKKRMISATLRNHLFKTVLSNMAEQTNASVKAFQCFETNFYFVNQKEGSIKREQNENVFRTKRMSLIGKEQAWKFAIFNENQRVREISRNLLISLVMNQEAYKFKERGKNVNKFIQEWIDQAENFSTENEQNFLNLLQILFDFTTQHDGYGIHNVNFDMFNKEKNYKVSIELDSSSISKSSQKFQLEVNESMKFGSIRLLAGKHYGIKPAELLIKTNTDTLIEYCMHDYLSQYKNPMNIQLQRRTLEENETELPRFIISRNMTILRFLVEKALTINNTKIILKTINFIDYLPINDLIKEPLSRQLSKEKFTKDLAPFYNYINVLETDVMDVNTPHILYGLSVITKLLQKSSFKAEFYKKSGFMMIISMMEQIEFEAFSQFNWLKIANQLISICSTILYYISKDDDAQEFSNDLIKFCLKFLENYLKIEVTKFDDSELDSMSQLLEQDFILSLMTLIDEVLSITPKQAEKFFKFQKFDQLIDKLLIHHSNEQIKNIFSQGLDKIMALDSVIAKEKIGALPTYFFYDKFLQDKFSIIMKSPRNNAVNNYKYFQLCNSVLYSLRNIQNSAESKKVWLLVSQIHELIINEKHFEERDDEFDSVLAGSFLLLQTLTKQFDDVLLKYESPIFKTDFLVILMENCLFKRDNFTGGNLYPISKHDITRKNAFNLLIQLCQINNEALPILSTTLIKYFSQTGWRTNTSDSWSIKAQKTIKKSKYVGLVNLGCTCYMNSIMQQLFMIPHFKKLIFETADKKKNEIPDEDNILYQTKLLFGHLEMSERPVHNPISFFRSIKDYDGSIMPTNEQRDVDEFMNIFIDKIEQSVKFTDSERTLKLLFGGKFAQELIGKQCPHTKIHDEAFTTVPIEVKNKKSVIEGLDSFIQGDLLEGDNAFLCERCDKKVDTLKRCSLKLLPNVLILVLKRFEFDLETLRRIKLNTYCEFPDEINMENYCQQTLAQRELQKKMKDQNITYDSLSPAQKQTYNNFLPQEYYNYKLKGTVIHFGTAEGGHYYSYLSERQDTTKINSQENWFEFNDNVVKDYAKSSLANDTYGGEYTGSEVFVIKQGNKEIKFTSKINNAYVLFYERDEFVDTFDFFDKIEYCNSKEQVHDLYNDCLLSNQSENVNEYEDSCFVQIKKDLKVSNDQFWMQNQIFNDTFMSTLANITNNYKFVENVNYKQAVTTDLQKLKQNNNKAQQELTLKFIITFYFGAVIRSQRRIHSIPKLVTFIKKGLSLDIAASLWLLECFSYPHIIKEFLIDCRIHEMREFTHGLLNIAMQTVYAYEQESIESFYDINEDVGQVITNSKSVPKLISFINSFILFFSTEIKNFYIIIGEFFAVFYSFSQLGSSTRKYLLAYDLHAILAAYLYSDQIYTDFEVGFLSYPEQTSDILLGNPSDYIIQELGKYEKENHKNSISQINNYDYVIKTISILIRSCAIEGKEQLYASSPTAMKDNSGKRKFLKVISRDSINYFMCDDKAILSNLLHLSKSRVVKNELRKLFIHTLAQEKSSVSPTIQMIFQNINDTDESNMKSYEGIFSALVSIDDEYKPNRIDKILYFSEKILKGNATVYSYTSNFINLIIKTASQSKEMQAELKKHRLSQQILEWLNMNATPISTRGARYFSKVNSKRLDASKAKKISSTFKSFSDRRIQDVKSWSKSPKQISGDDSEEDLSAITLQSGDIIDYCKNDEWLSYVVTQDLGEMINIKKKQALNQQIPDEWVFKNSNLLALAQRKTNNAYEENLAALQYVTVVHQNLYSSAKYQ